MYLELNTIMNMLIIILGFLKGAILLSLADTEVFKTHKFSIFLAIIAIIVQAIVELMICDFIA